jgi:hypothetical protein
LITDSRVSLSKYQLAAYETASALWAMKDSPLATYDLEKCPATIMRGKSYAVKYIGQQCRRRAGQGTSHEGHGNCVAHGGAKKEGRALGGWLMAHMYAQEYDVSPWEALLLVIRITAGKLRYIETVLATAESDDELEGRPTGQEVVGGPNDGGVEPGRNLSWWVEQSQLERQTLAKVSKAAIDAGVAQLLIERELRGGEALAQTFVKALEEMEKAGMPEESLETARTVLRGQLQLALES